MPHLKASTSAACRGRCAAALVAVLLGAALAGGCGDPQPEARVSYWAGADGVASLLHDPRYVEGLFDQAANRISLIAALDETVAFRVWADYTGPPDTPVSVVVDDWEFAGRTLAADSVTVYRVHAVEAPRWPGWSLRSIVPSQRPESIEDVLVPAEAPRGGLPCEMSDGDTLSLWFDVAVPKGTAPGVYWSKLRFTGADEDELAVADLRLEVLPYVLPDQVGVVLAAELDHAALFAHQVTYQGEPCRATRIAADSPIAAELRTVLDGGVRLLHRHQVTPLLHTLYPTVKVDALNKVSVYWDDYDRVVEGYLDGSGFIDRKPLALWPVPFDQSFPAPPSYGAVHSPGFSAYLRQYLALCAEHFEERGWLARSFVEVPGAEFPSAAAVTVAEHFARVIRRADPRLRVLCNLFPQDLAPYGWPGFPVSDLLGYVDVWCPQAQFYAPPNPIAGVQPAEMWMRADRPPYSGSIGLAGAAADPRVLAWQGWREEAAVVRLGLANRWPEPAADLSLSDCVGEVAGGRADDAPLIYPGWIAGLADPLPSVRLKRLRRGMQDLAYLELMRAKGLEHVAEVLAGSVAQYAGAQAYRHHYADPRPDGWVRDPRRWRQVRRIILDELNTVLAPESVDRRTRTAANVRWQRFTAAVREERVEVEGVRVRRHGPAAMGAATVDCAIIVHNPRRTAFSGVLDFVELPVGWTGPAEPIAVFVPPGDSARVVLSADAPVITWDDDGVRYLPMELRIGDGRVRPFSARMCCVAAQPFFGGLRIDGELSDWPPGAGNLASDFVLISGESPESVGSGGYRASNATKVYAAADAQALYFALECAAPGVSSMRAAHTNVVEYDDLVPVGAELAEIVLDPSGAGTHSTADLYHLVIKPTGALWERGVRTDPPTGLRAIWPADIQYAARVHADRWVAEIRIPWEALGDDLPGGRIWGVNFSRFDLPGQEYSNWAGAPGNFYDPASLGNLALP